MRTYKTNQGYIEYYPEPEYQNIYIDFITADNGHGTSLLKGFISSIDTQQYKTITLLANDGYGSKTKRLERFYVKNGFKEVHRNNFGIDYTLTL